MDNKTIRIKINGKWLQFEQDRDVHSEETLLHLLREKLGLTGIKQACDQGACGACTVLLNGKAVLSCMMLAVEADGKEVLTIEGLSPDEPLISSFSEQSEPGYGTAMQCGFCTPGFIMAAKGLLIEKPHPSKAEIEEALSGNLCRCGCYPAITKAVQNASTKTEKNQ